MIDVKKALLLMLAIFLPLSLYAWVAVSNPSPSEDDVAYAITGDDNFVYIAGYQSNYPGLVYKEWRVERRQKFTGILEWGVSNNDAGVALAITDDNGYIYIAGYDAYTTSDYAWRIEKRYKSTGECAWTRIINLSSTYDLARAISNDNDYIYVAGPRGGTNGWRVAKRRKDNGDVEWAIQSNPPSGNIDAAYAITDDDEYIYIAGRRNDEWLIEKRRKDNGALEWAKVWSYGTCAYAITAEGDYIYVAGVRSLGYSPMWLIEKRLKSNGNTVWSVTSDPSSGGDVARAIATDNGHIYVAGYDVGGGWPTCRWRIEKRQKSDGTLVQNWTRNPSNNDDIAYAITADNDYVCIAGMDSVPDDNSQWRIEGIANYGVEDGKKRDVVGPLTITPNPFQSHAKISYTVGVPEQGSGTAVSVHMSIYDLTGRLVRSPVIDKNQPGIHTVTLDSNDMSCGVYFVVMEVGNRKETKTLILIK